MAGGRPSAPGPLDAEIFEIRVRVDTGQNGGPGRRARRWPWLVGCAACLAAIVGLLLASPWSAPRRPALSSAELRAESAVAPHVESGPVVAAHLDGAPGVAAAYGYPQRCLSVTILGTDPNYARAEFDHALPCRRYAGYDTAIFHRVHGVWRVVASGARYRCPLPGVPLRVQAALGVCGRPEAEPTVS